VFSVPELSLAQCQFGADHVRWLPGKVKAGDDRSVARRYAGQGTEHQCVALFGDELLFRIPPRVRQSFVSAVATLGKYFSGDSAGSLNGMSCQIFADFVRHQHSLLRSSRPA
jgi:hypothetical protein